jgi:paraquat-inducible protein A
MDLFGLSSENLISGGIGTLWKHGWILLASIAAVLVVVLPFIRFGLLSAVLGALILGIKGRWLGPAFRWAYWLDPWAMADVFLLASFVGFYRLANVSQAHLTIELGGACFIAAAFLTMLSRATLDRRTVWRAIGPEQHGRPGELTLSCVVCDIIQPVSREVHPCPRCGATLHTRLPASMPRTTALLLAAFILFFPANIYPMNISTQLGAVENYTIFDGIKDLFQNGLWPLGFIIFCTSILIPFGKIVAIGWCVWSVHVGSKKHIILKTKIFRAVAELGRW